MKRCKQCGLPMNIRVFNQSFLRYGRKIQVLFEYDFPPVSKKNENYCQSCYYVREDWKRSRWKKKIECAGCKCKITIPYRMWIISGNFCGQCNTEINKEVLARVKAQKNSGEEVSLLNGLIRK